MVKPVAWRRAAGHLRASYEISERRASRLLSIHRSSLRYAARSDDSGPLRERLRGMAVNHPRWGYRLMTDTIRFGGWIVNPKRVYRVYCEERLQLPRRRKKQLRSVQRQPLIEPIVVNQRWSMDFMADMLADARRFRTLNVLDDSSRENLAIELAFSIPGERVTRVLDRIAEERGYPESILMDNGPEFTGRAMDRWASIRGVRLQFIEPGKPNQNAFVESFNDKFRTECLNLNWFANLWEARRVVEDWRHEYNHERPHSSLGRIPPAVYAARQLRKAVTSKLDQ